jgi:hypothetical protein
MKTGEELRQRREARYEAMSDEKVRQVAEENLRKLHEMTKGHGDEAVMRANSVRFAWKELQRRGLPNLDTQKIREAWDPFTETWKE